MQLNHLSGDIGGLDTYDIDDIIDEEDDSNEDDDNDGDD
jgi:hypothetical protein